MKSSLKSILLKKEYYIYFVLILAFFLRNYITAKHGIYLSINSDDAGYVRSAKELLESGTLSYHKLGSPTVHIMPGQPVLLAAIFLIFGQGDLGMYIAKLTMILFGLLSIYGVYLIGSYIHNIWTGLISAVILAISVPHIVIDNLTLTESPFMFCLIYFIYFSIKLANEKKYKFFYFLLTFYICGLMIRPTIALIPFILIPFFLLKKYPFKLMIKQAGIALCIIIVVLSPWCIRNYNHFHTFIPLTASSGDPLLLGTFQGYGYPDDETYDDVIANVKEVMPVNDAYYELKYTNVFAKERMKQWWNNDPISMLKSYLWEKPKIIWKNVYYKIPVFNITHNELTHIHKTLMVLAILGSFICFVFSQNRKSEMALVLLTLAYFTAINSYYYANPRYVLPLEPFIYLCSAVFITLSVTTISRLIIKFQNRKLYSYSPE